MKISKLAQCAQVSVRTIRHYHAIGILHEPSRPNRGYRQYTARHLAILLRIRTLRDAGFSLAHIAQVTSYSGDTSLCELTSAVERDIDAHIARLINQKRLLQRIRLRDQFSSKKSMSHSHCDTSMGSEDESMDIELTELLSWIMGTAALTDVIAGMAACNQDKAYAFYGLTDAASEADIDAVSDEISRSLQCVSHQSIDSQSISHEKMDVLMQYLDKECNSAQRRAIQRVISRYDAK